MYNPERRMMAAVIAAGVVRIDSSRHSDPEAVAKTSIAIADQICSQTAEDGESPGTFAGMNEMRQSAGD